jgi:hypothetical protein
MISVEILETDLFDISMQHDARIHALECGYEFLVSVGESQEVLPSWKMDGDRMAGCWGDCVS